MVLQLVTRLPIQAHQLEGQRVHRAAVLVIQAGLRQMCKSFASSFAAYWVISCSSVELPPIDSCLLQIGQSVLFQRLFKTPADLELLICGRKELDFEALRSNTIYDDGFTKDSPVIR